MNKPILTRMLRCGPRKSFRFSVYDNGAGGCYLEISEHCRPLGTKPIKRKIYTDTRTINSVVSTLIILRRYMKLREHR